MFYLVFVFSTALIIFIVLTVCLSVMYFVYDFYNKQINKYGSTEQNSVKFRLCTAGRITEDRLREVMTTMGDRWSDDKVDELFHCSPITEGLFNYVDFVRAIKHGTRRDADDDPFRAAATPASSRGGSGGGSKSAGSKNPSVAPMSDVVVHV